MAGLLDTANAARFLGITESQLRGMQYRREIPFIKVGRSVRYDPKDLEQYIRSRRVNSYEWSA